MVPDDQPVGGARDQRGGHADLEDGDEARLAACRADRGEPPRAERAAGELGAEADDHRGRASPVSRPHSGAASSDGVGAIRTVIRPASAPAR